MRRSHHLSTDCTGLFLSDDVVQLRSFTAVDRNNTRELAWLAEVVNRGGGGGDGGGELAVVKR